MIGLLALAAGCTAFAAFCLNLLSPLVRRMAASALPLGYYVIFVMPAGGADNPLPILIGGCCLAVTLAGILLELATLFRKLGAKAAGANG